MNKLKRLNDKYRVLIYTLLGVLCLFLFWWLLSLLAKSKGASTLFPGPEVVIPIAFNMLKTKEIYEAIGGTLLRLAFAMLIGISAGLVFGILGGLFKSYRAFIKPFIITLRTIPTASVIFILIVLIEKEFASSIIVFLITFPILYEAVSTGIANIDKSIIDAVKIDGASTFKATFKIYLPLSTPYILLGVIQSLGLGMKVSIMAEILSGSHYNDLPGIGQLLYLYSISLEADNILAVSLIAIFLVGLIEIALYFAKKKCKSKII